MPGLYKYILCALALMPLALVAQNKEESISGKVADHYDKVYGADQRLISGSFYYNPPKGSVTGHPYYISDEWKKSSIKINGTVFENLDMKYNITDNKVIINYKSIDNAWYKLSLRNEDIEWFRMDDRLFVHHPFESENGNKRFCELMCAGDLSYYVQASKALTLSRGSALSNYYYQSSFRQFIIKDGKLHPFGSIGKLYKLIPERKKELKQYKKMQELDLKRTNFSDRAILIDYYNANMEEEN